MTHPSRSRSRRKSVDRCREAWLVDGMAKRPSTRSIDLDRAFKTIANAELRLSEIELRIVLEQLGRTHGSISRAAELLGVNRRTLQRKLKRGFERRRKRRRKRNRR